jgi:hypothetical protein
MNDRTGQVWMDDDGEIFLVIGPKAADCHPIVWLHCIPSNAVRTLNFMSERFRWDLVTYKKRIS